MERPRRTPMAAALVLVAVWSAAAVGTHAHEHAAAHRALLASHPGFKPRSCGAVGNQTADIQADLQRFESRLAAARGSRGNARTTADSIRNIGVYVHVIRASTSPTAGNVPRTWINNQIAVLNKEFAQAKFKFLLKGVTYTTDASGYRMGPGTSTELRMKKKLKRGDITTLNIYTNRYDDTLAGWAYLPSDLRYIPSTADGVVIAWDTLPGAGTRYFSKGKTAVHEVGHWLGLLHTFQAARDSAGNNLGGCVGSGDFVSDTPPQLRPNFGFCDQRVDTCKATGLDPIRNFMDYSVDDCRTQFTYEQRKRMKLMFSRYRASGTGYGNQGSNNDGSRLALRNTPSGGVPKGCSSCACYPEGYCICSCSGREPRVVPA